MGSGNPAVTKAREGIRLNPMRRNGMEVIKKVDMVCERQSSPCSARRGSVSWKEGLCLTSIRPISKSGAQT